MGKDHVVGYEEILSLENTEIILVKNRTAKSIKIVFKKLSLFFFYLNKFSMYFL